MNLSQSDIAAAAQKDLAQRLGITVEEIEVREVRAMTWPDTSLGCPQPGQVYAQVIQKGWLIRLNVNGKNYLYHSGETQPPFLCNETPLPIPQATQKIDERVPPPDSDID
jgi:hypothetical protein